MQQRYSRWIGAFGRLSTLSVQAGSTLPLWAALLAGSLIMPAAHGSDTANQQLERQGVVDRIIVKWRTDSIAATTGADQRAKRISVHGKRTFRHQRLASSGQQVLQLEHPVARSQMQHILTELNQDPDIEYAELDHRRYPQLLPSDSAINEQWYLLDDQPAATAADRAWDITTGSASTIVAVLDTGVRYEHPDLGRVESGGKLLPGYDFVSTPAYANDGDGRDADASDPGDWLSEADLSQRVFSECRTGASSWHGTRVASLVGAQTNNGTGVAGLGWDTSILPVRVLGRCGGFDSDIIDGMRWAAGLRVPGVPDNPNPAQILNLSLGGASSCTRPYREAIDEIMARGVLIVASVGNEGGPVSAPANCPRVLGVTGLRHAGTKVGFSNLGNGADIGAPGGNCVNTAAGQPCQFSIIAATNAGATTPGQSTYTTTLNFNVGTSFAAPLVAATAALMHSVNANLRPADYLTLLQQTARPFPATSETTTRVCRNPQMGLQPEECICTTATCGAGMLNAAAAVIAATRPFVIIDGVQDIAPDTIITLDGSDSYAANGRSIVSYRWSLMAGAGMPPSFTDVDQPTTQLNIRGDIDFTVQLTVTDDAGGIGVARMGLATQPVAEPPPLPPLPDTPIGRGVSGNGGGGVMHPGLLVGLLWLLAMAAWRRAGIERRAGR